MGTARKALAALTATRPPRPVWPRTTPSPPPRTMARQDHRHRELELVPEEGRDALRTGPVRRGGEPAEDVGDEGHVSSTTVARRRERRPRDDQSFGADQEEVGHRGQGDGEDQADDDRCVVGDVEAVGDLLAQAAQADQSRDGDQADHRGRGHAQTREDVGQGERQIDSQQGGRGRVPERGRRFTGVGRDGIESGHRVPDEDQQRVAHQRDLRGLVRGRRSR